MYTYVFANGTFHNFSYFQLSEPSHYDDDPIDGYPVSSEQSSTTSTETSESSFSTDLSNSSSDATLSSFSSISIATAGSDFINLFPENYSLTVQQTIQVPHGKWTCFKKWWKRK